MVDVMAVGGSELDENIQGHFELFCVGSTHHVNITIMDNLELKSRIEAKYCLLEGIIKEIFEAEITLMHFDCIIDNIEFHSKLCDTLKKLMLLLESNQRQRMEKLFTFRINIFPLVLG